MAQAVCWANDYREAYYEIYEKYSAPEKFEAAEKLVNLVLNKVKPEYRNKDLFELYKQQYDKAYTVWMITGRKNAEIRKELKYQAKIAAIVYMGIALGIIK